jgi:catechol 2,3-dioxygenase-like lactoylglutathione lyase family enzyme
MRVKQVDLVSVSTRDYERAARWYCEVLGLPMSKYSEGEIETPRERHAES